MAVRNPPLARDGTDTTPTAAPTAPAAPAPSSVYARPAPFITRLNERGIRLVHIADVVLLLGVMFLTMVMRFGVDVGGPRWQGTTYSVGQYLLSWGVATTIFVVVVYFGGLYERQPRLGYPPALPRAVVLSLVAVLLFFGGVWVISGGNDRLILPAPRANLVPLFILGSLGIAANRRIAHLMRTRREGPSRVLLVGAPDEIDSARQHLVDDDERAHVVGEASDIDDLVDQCDQLGVTDVLLLSSRGFEALYPRVLTTLEQRRVSVLQRVTARETLYGLQGVREVGGMPFVLLRTHTLPVSRTRFKRTLELVGLLVTLPLWLPLLGLLALYQLLVVRPPIMFLQERVGKEGRLFRMVKFRTMHPEAEEDGGPQLAIRDDPRIIPACRWLRKTRLDELPQIWNVLRGEMSLVGPRPERPELTARFEQVIPGYSRRHDIPPGITGLAQIHGRYDTDPEYKLGYDLQYLVNWSPVLDLQILARTVWVVLARRI